VRRNRTRLRSHGHAGAHDLRRDRRVVSTVLGWHIQPHWFALALLALFPLAVWIGYKLRVRGAEPIMVSGAV
jgi:hypothetical protein